MAIDQGLLDRIVAASDAIGGMAGKDVLILGDCRFIAKWASDDNRADLAKFASLYQLGRVETMDIAGNPTIRADLHEPLPDGLRSCFDLIIDPGTLYCCFDVAAVLRNMLLALKDRGMIVNHSALTGYFGRGYYNLHPMLFIDFYDQNGFSVILLEMRAAKSATFLLRVWRKLFRMLGRPTEAFAPVAGTFLARSTQVGMLFSQEYRDPPGMLPNETTILCAALREQRKDFVRPIPPFFMSA